MERESAPIVEERPCRLIRRRQRNPCEWVAAARADSGKRTKIWSALAYLGAPRRRLCVRRPHPGPARFSRGADFESCPTLPRVTTTAGVEPDRKGYVDLFRGLLIAHMALDHASLMFNRHRGGEELARAAPHVPADIWQFLTRFTGVPVAPGFCFMAGFMVAATTASRLARGTPSDEITRRLVTRGLVLIAVDALIMGLPRMLMGFYSFMVLTLIGMSILLLVLLRNQPTALLAALAVAILGLHPLLDVSGLPVALRAALYEPVREGAVRSLYPLIPWFGVVLLGFVVGRDAETRERPSRFWLVLAALCAAVFVSVRAIGGYGNAYAHGGVLALDFWFFAKYPPDLPFLSFSLAAVFAALAGLEWLCRAGVPRALHPFVVFGRVPFFFYIVHFYVLGLTQGVLRIKLGLGGAYVIWLILLFVIYWPCAWYHRKKRERPNFVTRYV